MEESRLTITELPADKPAWAYAEQLSNRPHLLYIDNAEPSRGRYSYISADPQGMVHGQTLDDLQQMIDRLGQLPQPLEWGLPPFQGGLAGVINYGFGTLLEPKVPTPQRDEFGFPKFSLGFYDWALAFDHKLNRCLLMVTGYDGESGFTTMNATQRTDEVLAWLYEKSTPKTYDGTRLTVDCHNPIQGDVTSNFTKNEYLAAIRRAIDYIHAGDCFQVNIAQRLMTPLVETPFQHYLRLRKCNPAPYACYFDAGTYQVLSASPEQFVDFCPFTNAGRGIFTSPIKGTRPRSADPVQDAALIHDLQHSEKDRAENVMIVDLLRNDLGRVCQWGSVKVPRLCELHSFEHVHHLVSKVSGMLRDDITPFDVLKATFPGGSITGAPKVRAMQIITELEQTARGPYCGSAVLIGFNGTMQSNILIRTMTAAGGWLQFPVGSGIVADSVPELEYEETLHKAQGMLQAAQGGSR